MVSIAAALDFFQTLDLRLAHGLVVYVQHVDFFLFVGAVAVHAHDDVFAGVDAGLLAGGRFLDAHFRQARFNGLRHAAQALHFLDQRPGFFDQLFGQVLDVVRAAPGIDGRPNIGFVLQEKLRVPGDAGRKIGRQRHGLVQRVSVQRLRVAQHSRRGLHHGAGDVVEWVLFGQAVAARLAVRPQGHRLGVFRPKFLHDFGPKYPPGPHFGNFHKMVHPDAPEKRQPGRKAVDVQPRAQAGAQVLLTVGQGVGQFELRRGTRLVHVVAADADGVELRHVPRGVGKNIADDAHRR